MNMRLFGRISLVCLTVTSFYCNFSAGYEKTLPVLKEQEKLAGEWIRRAEKEASYMEERKKYWEYQLTGLRRFAYPKGWIRDMVQGWIDDYEIQANKKRSELKKWKQMKTELDDQIYALETRVPEPGGPKQFSDPRWETALVDNCLFFADQCGGNEAAAEFCKLMGFNKAIAHDLNYKNPGRTVVLGEAKMVGGKKNPKRICSPKGGSGTTASPSGVCVSFKYIKCQ
jgi:hypothetical protein